MSIDQAFERFCALLQEVPAEDAVPINESTTRFRLIDPLLVDVLGWPRSAVETELKGGHTAGGGDARLDYLLSNDDGPWFVVEAKKRIPPLIEPTGRTDKFKMGGPVLKNVLPIIEGQMAPYFGLHMPRFGLVTTGDQWVGFLVQARSPRLTHRTSWALVFPSLDHVKDDFLLFYRAFSMEEGTRSNGLTRILGEARGAIVCSSPARGVALDISRPLDYRPDELDFYNDLRRAMNTAFGEMERDSHALETCFVESRQSKEADVRLRLIQNELGEVLNDAAGYPKRVEEEVEARPGRDGVSLPSAEDLRGQGCLVRILGERSAGKSVFLRRFYEATLARAARKQIALVWLDANAFPSWDSNTVSAYAIEQLKRALFDDAGPDAAQLRDVYARRWNEQLRAKGYPSTAQPEDLVRSFAELVLSEERANPHASLARYAEYAVRNRGRLPCFIVDNADSEEKCRHAMSWAVATHLATFSLTTVALDDATLWRLRERGADDEVGHHAPEQFWLPRPKVREVIEARCNYLRSMLQTRTGDAATTRTKVGYRRQFQWTVSADDLVRVVTNVLLGDEQVSQWLGQVCNFNLREVLELCKRIVLSPRVKATSLLKTQVTGKGVDLRTILRTIIAPKNEQFQGHPTDMVVNVFGFWAEDRWAPLLPARLLVWLAKREDDETNQKQPFPGFVVVDRIEERFETDLGVPRTLTVAALERLRAQALIETRDPSTGALRPDAAVRILPRGRVHLTWCQESSYVRMMAEVDPCSDPHAAAELKQTWEAFLDASRAEGPTRTQRMAQAEQRLVCRYIEHVVQEANRVSAAPQDGQLAVLDEWQDSLLKFWIDK